MNEVFVPALGMAPDDVVLVSWLKQPGENVGAGEPIAVVETAKAELEVESPGTGQLGPHIFPAGARVAPGATISHVLDAGESPPQAGMPSTELASSDADPAPEAAHAEPAAAPRPDKPHQVSPRQRRLAFEAAVNRPAPEVPPTPREPVPLEGPAPATPAVMRSEPTVAPAPQKVDRHREAIAAAVSRSWQEIPHFAVSREIGMEAAAETLRGWRIVLPRLTLTDLLLRAYALALIDREGRTDIALGLAVATPRGVVIPIIPAIPQLDLAQLSSARKAAVQRSREGRMTADDGMVAAGTLSNLGSYGVDSFTGVVPLGQTALLTVGRAAQRPVVRDGQLAVGTTMVATLNVDHRSWDGGHAALVLDRLATILATPSLLAAAGTVGEGSPR